MAPPPLVVCSKRGVYNDHVQGHIGTVTFFSESSSHLEELVNIVQTATYIVHSKSTRKHC